MKLYNTLKREIELFQPYQEGLVKIYSCGPTIYNYAHIGNLRAFLFADFLQRVLREVEGYTVQWVMNLTDIDDKTIRDSRIGSEQWRTDMGEQTDNPLVNLRKLTDYYADAFLRDIETIGIRAADFMAMPRATDFIPQMQDLIVRIATAGFAYSRGGSVYFDVGKWSKSGAYGQLHSIDFEHFQEGVRIDADEYDREQVSDFVLWKAVKEGEPYWDFEFEGESLPGRPGWHIECSAMEYELLGLPFDIHTGGIDLRFPHHEDEIAQSTAGYGIAPTLFWCHNEFLDVEGEKMSKSKGNFFTLRDLLEKKLHPKDIRYLMLSAHYRSRLNFTFSGLEAGAKARKRVQEYIHQLFSLIPEVELPESQEISSDTPLAELFRQEIYNALRDDLNAPKALAAVFTFIGKHSADELSVSERKAVLAVFRILNTIFDVWEIAPKSAEEIIIPEHVLAIAEQRLAAKKEKRWADADALRAEIQTFGFIVKDTKEGFELLPV